MRANQIGAKSLLHSCAMCRLGKIPNPTPILDACQRRCVSRRMLVLLRWKVPKVMYYRAKNSVSQDLPSGFASKITYKAGSVQGADCFLPVNTDIRAPGLMLCTPSVYSHMTSGVLCCTVCYIYFILIQSTRLRFMNSVTRCLFQSWVTRSLHCLPL